jgi:hypothetical protein
MAHEVDVILEDEEVFEIHDLDGRTLLACLRTRARFVRGDGGQRP